MKTKHKVKKLDINLQQGFLLFDDNNQPVAAYSHHNKVIYFKIPFFSEDIEIPTEFNDYKLINKKTDSFGINMWTNEGTTNI